MQNAINFFIIVISHIIMTLLIKDVYNSILFTLFSIT